MKQLHKYKSALLFLTVFTLPMYTILNNIFLGLYIVLCLFDGNFNFKINSLKRNYKQLIPIGLFFALALIASLHNSESFFLKTLEKYWSFILIPLAVLVQDNFYHRHKHIMFKGLAYGSALTLIICYLNAFYELIAKSEPIFYFFRWRHLGHEFTQIADTHPAYLGLFIVTSILYIFSNKEQFSKKIRLGLLVFFSLGMFQLASRTALLIYVLILLFYLIYNYRRRYKKATLVLAALGIITVIFFSFGSEYLKDRMFSPDAIEKDTRFERLVVPYQIFKENPLLGYGLDKIVEKRNELYIESGFIVAAHKNYNAHNQIMDYLSINGILGVLVYLLTFLFLAIKTYKNQNYLFLCIFIVFFITNLSESMLLRIKGIEFFALFTLLFISSLNFNNRKITKKEN